MRPRFSVCMSIYYGDVSTFFQDALDSILTKLSYLMS